MAKIFISYKYGDGDVQPLLGPTFLGTTARHYVDVLQSVLEQQGNHINKGENDDESLTGFKDETIATKLRDKIYDSSVTVVLISKSMRSPGVAEKDQWIPWEVAYSLKEVTRDGRMSKTNAVLAVVLPDANGSYDYFVKSICVAGCQSWQTDTTFGVIGRNMFNRKQPNLTRCGFHGQSSIHTGNDHSYIHPVRWADFIRSVDSYIRVAQELNERIDEFELSKVV